MNDGTSEPRCCEVCGGPVRAENKEGICSRTAECRRLRVQKMRDANRAQRPAPKSCEICGGPLRRDNKIGVCRGRNSPACRQAGRRRAREGKRLPFPLLLIKTGDTIGQWTAMEDYTPDNRRILVRCACGTERRVRGNRLASGESRSCGCARHKPRRNKPPYLAADDVYDRLTVLEDVTYWNEDAYCRCECGREITTKARQVKNAITRSCGCLSRERSTTHGFTGQPLYGTWNGMMDRCNNPNHPSYASYGGRGIAVCERWRDPWLFAEDIEREIGPRPEGCHPNGRPKYSLDRWPDNDGNYEPGNVRWANGSEQVLNQRKVADLTRVTFERNALAAELAALKASLQA